MHSLVLAAKFPNERAKVFSDRFLPLPIRYVTGSKGPVPADPATDMGKFYRLDTRMLLKLFNPSSMYAVLPFDYYCPSLRKGGKLNRMVCKTCGEYFAMQVACKNHHCAPDDHEEDYEDMSDDDEVAAHVPASPEDIPNT
ncbi:hypothetical protein BV898_05235 [Hypsibius exemplaris]|uniref:C2H2-type domain-containing protein n=1 Tax=Hypsibius exemplaris TaxID=2072580 RepID=A0A1W0X0D6_HYPEX|nr:hypothetical protein BV898_05235 [Hypsibius exemplaris]